MVRDQLVRRLVRRGRAGRVEVEPMPRAHERPGWRIRAEHAAELLHELVGRVLLGGLERIDEREHVRVAAGQPLPDDLERRVMMLAPSMRWRPHRHVALPTKLALPREIPAPPRMSMPSTRTRRPRSVHDCFMIDEHHRSLVVVNDRVGQLGAGQHNVRLAAGTRKRLLNAAKLGNRHAELLAHARSTDARADGARRTHAPAGSETPRPSAKHSTNMCQPKPQRCCPPRMECIGTQTSSPLTVPLKKAALRGM